MSYIALYRKWRPVIFDDLVGQEATSTVLKNQVKNNKIAHAYLFCGGRGTGKTSAAKILARAVNCLNPKDGNPCNQCEICKGIMNGEIMDVVEMDAASNNGVDDVRQIRDEVVYTPTKSRYRVYIIDEVHMFSSGAYNALLKTLEEPPEHVIFILATTEQHKIPSTILSRCQRYEFKQITKENIIKRLELILKESNISFEKEALELISILADGALRDAISILDQCISIGNEITVENIVDIVGIIEQEEVYKLAENIIDMDFNNSINLVNNYFKSGKNLEQLMSLLIKFFRDLLVYKTTKSQDDIYTNVMNFDKLKALADKVKQDKLINIIFSLSELSNRLKWATQPKILIEVELVKLCTIQVPQIIPNENDFQIIKTSDKQLFETEVKNTKLKKEDIIKQEKNNKKKNDILNLQDFNNWKEVLNQLRTEGNMILYSNMVGVKPFIISDIEIGIKFSKESEKFGKTIFHSSKNKENLEKAIEKVTNKKMKVTIIDDNTVITNEVKYDKVTEMANKFNIPINIIEN